MIRWGVSCKSVTPLHFCDKEVSTEAKVYQQDVLEVFGGEHWIFQQDSAPARKAKTI